MPISQKTNKRLFGLSRNQCAMPRCVSPLVVGETVVGELCHIRARRKAGPRYDPAMTAAERDGSENLVLLCSTCHKLVDADPDRFTPERLAEIKRAHEAQEPERLHLSEAELRQAEILLQHHLARTKRTSSSAGDVTVGGPVQANAATGGVALVITGSNQGTVNVRTSSPQSAGPKYPANSIGADANMSGYVEYLIGLYVKYMKADEPDEGRSFAKIGQQIKRRYRLDTRTRGHLPVAKFRDLVEFIVDEKLAKTRVGRKHLRDGTKLCATFEEWRSGHR